MDSTGLQRRRQGHEFGGVARGAFELVDGEDDRLVWRGPFDFLSEGDGFVVLGTDLDAAADLLGEDALATGGAQGVELNLEILLGGGAAGVPDAEGRGGVLSQLSE